MAKRIQDITTEKQFLSALRTYYRKMRRKGRSSREISFLGLMVCVGPCTSEFEALSGKYFSLGIRAYDWQRGNSLLADKIGMWESEMKKGK